MRRSDKILIHIVLPTHVVVDQLPETVLELEDFGITLKDIYRTATNVWADYHGQTPISRSLAAATTTPAIRQMDDLTAVDYVVNTDLIEPMMDSHVTPNQYETIRQVTVQAAVLFYLDMDKQLRSVLNLSDRGELTLHRWFGNDAVLRYVA